MSDPQHLRQQRRPVDRGRTEQLETIVVDRDRKRARLVLRNAPGDQARQPQMHLPARERIQKQVRSFARVEHFGQQNLWRRQCRPLLLDLQQGPHALQFWRVIPSLLRQSQLLQHGVGQRGRQRQSAAAPARHGRALAYRAAHPGGHLVDAHQLQQPAAEQKAIAGLQARDKTLLDAADSGATKVLNRHRRIAHDGADVHAMAPRQTRIGHTPDPRLVRHRASVVRVRRERGPALGHETQAPRPVLARQVGVSGRAAYLVIQRIGHEAAAQRHRDQMLHQHIERLQRRAARFDIPSGNGGPRSSAFHHFDAVRRHQRDARRPARRMTGTAGTLQQAGDALGRTDLQHALHRQKIDTQVQAGSAHHRLEFTAFETELDPLPHRAVE